MSDIDVRQSTQAETGAASIEEHLRAQAPGISDEELEQLGLDVLKECRNSLMMRFRYLDSALWRMPLNTEQEIYCLLTDGQKLSFGPRAVAVKFRKQPDEVVRDLLHLVLHCIFRHPYDDKYENGEVYSLCCDILVESLAMEMCGEQFTSSLDRKRQGVVDALRQTCGSLAPNKLYHYIYDKVDDGVLCSWNKLFQRDSHVFWPALRMKMDRPGQERQEGETRKSDEQQQVITNQETEGDTTPRNDIRQAAEMSGEAEEPRQEPEGEESQPQDQQEQSQESQDIESTREEEDEQLANLFEDLQPRSLSELDEEMKKAWEGVAKQVEMELTKRNIAWGEGGGTLMSTLAVANRQTYDYADFLRKFSTMAEDLQVNDDEFDYIYYTYGMERYGNMPLVEPLEYKDSDRVREFAIAIDTSGSCSGELVKIFIQRTYDILMESESFGSKVNVHIIQCDARIQKDVKITSLKELDKYIDNIRIYGYGGTDFRPVFAYVNDLVEQGEFEDLRGLIYFTDGLGIFPIEKPPYDAAFVFVSDDMVAPHVPPWAMKVVLDEDGIKGAS